MRKMIDVDFGSSRYDQLVELRYKILLEPLGLKFLDIPYSMSPGLTFVKNSIKMLVRTE